MLFKESEKTVCLNFVVIALINDKQNYYFNWTDLGAFFTNI